jgi:hypothetical protein
VQFEALFMTRAAGLCAWALRSRAALGFLHA